jgi:hypothetical protein
METELKTESKEVYEIEKFMKEVDEYYKDPPTFRIKAYKNSINISLLNIKIQTINKNKSESHF